VIKDLQVGMGMGVVFLYQVSENVESDHAVARCASLHLSQVVSQVVHFSQMASQGLDF
jgi:hypothetical protein